MDTWRVRWPEPSPHLLHAAWLCSRLRHPNLVRVRPQRGRDRAEYAIEHVHGSPLRDLLEPQRYAGWRTPPAIACWIGFQACGALQYLHTECDSQGRPLRLVHGGISPRTVWLTHGGEVKIVTLPWALQVGGTAEWTEEMEEERRRCLSPEQLLGQDAGPTSDIFALGACLYELLCGEPAFFEDARSQVEPLHFRCPDLPAVVCDTVMQALAPDPAKRHASAARMRQALGKCKRHLPAFERAELKAWMGELLESWTTEDGAMTSVHPNLRAKVELLGSFAAFREP